MGKNILNIEAFSGLSGDMFLGALAGLCNAYDELIKLPKLLNLEEARVEIKEVDKNGIHCNHVKVVDTNAGTQHHNHRHLSNILKIIEGADITDHAKVIAKSIFLIIGKSESKIHNIPIEKIHFHEVGAIDSLIDIIGSAVLLDRLNIEKSYSTPICTGKGMVNTQHGLLPVPAPATADILKGVPIFPGDEEGERATPTGAAILKYLNPEFKVPALLTESIAYGPGQKDFISPNVLRLSLCSKTESPGKMYMVETNIDDMSMEYLGQHFQDKLLANGAVDFYYTNIQMKKSRPGIKLTCMASEKNIDTLANYILENTTTIGLRYFPVEKKRLGRTLIEVDSPFGKVKAKVIMDPSGKQRITLEYDDLVRLNKELGIPLHELNQKIMAVINTKP